DIERTPRGLVERTGRLAIQPLHKSDVTVFGVDHRIGGGGRLDVVAAIFPQRLERARRGRIVDLSKEAAQPFALRAAVFGINGIVDVDVEFGREEFRKGHIGEVEHITAAADELDQLLDEPEIDGAEAAHTGLSATARGVRPVAIPPTAHRSDICLCYIAEFSLST